MRTHAKKYKNISMRLNKFIWVACLALVLAGCGAKKKVAETKPEEVQPAVPAWHTCLIQNARATVTRGGDRLSAQLTMQAVRDSLAVISVMPMLGMEMLRIEATPIEVIVIDKLHAQYGQATYADINRKLTPSMNWDIMQQLCSAELPTGDQRARLVYQFGKETIELVIDYPPRQLDVPIRISHLPLTKYKKADISKWL